MKNIDLGKTPITDKVRVSSAALHREEWHGSWWLVETWIFSDDPRQRSVQVVHGSCASGDGECAPHEPLCAEARKIHAYMAAGLRNKFSCSQPPETDQPQSLEAIRG